jgi:hypothetical protein
VVCIEEYDGLSNPENFDLNFFETWIQIHKLPVGYRKKPLITNLTERKVGKVSEVQIDVQGAGNFVRARVKLDVRIPLARFVSLSRAGQREIYQIKFEKMPRFCGACGMIGHSHLECGTGEFEEDKLKWGDWLKADWDSWHGRGFGAARGGGRSARSGRNGQGGRGQDYGFGRGRDPRGAARNTSWRFNAINREEEDLADTGTSPVKRADTDMDERDSTDSGAKRRLALELPLNSNDVNPETGMVPMLTDENQARTEVAETERNKRSKKDGANSPSLGSAGSREESVRSQ